jgi:hypothetical protein
MPMRHAHAQMRRSHVASKMRWYLSLVVVVTLHQQATPLED